MSSAEKVGVFGFTLLVPMLLLVWHFFLPGWTSDDISALGGACYLLVWVVWILVILFRKRSAG